MTFKPLSYNGILPTISPEALIAPNAIISGEVDIAADANIWFNCVIRGDLAPIKIGRGTNVQDGTVIHVSRPNHPNNKSGDQGGPAIIGNGVTIGHQACLHACIVGDYAFIGMKALVLDMAVIEEEAFVAAGAVIPPGKKVARGEIWAGNPGRFLRKMSESETRYLKQSEANYIKLAKEYFS